jgi:phage FluMu protein Com
MSYYFDEKIPGLTYTGSNCLSDQALNSMLPSSAYGTSPQPRYRPSPETICPVCGGSTRPRLEGTSCSRCGSAFTWNPKTARYTMDVLCSQCESPLKGVSKGGTANPFTIARSGQVYSATLKCGPCGTSNNVRIDARNGVQVKKSGKFVKRAVTLGMVATAVAFLSSGGSKGSES